MFDFFPQELQRALEKIPVSKLYEIRLRAGFPVRVNYQGTYAYLSASGITKYKENALKTSMEEIEEIVYRAGKFSVYAVEEEIKRGFITATGGIRIGLSGEFVYEKGVPLTIRNISSLCIRIPHDISGCSDQIYEKCMYRDFQSLIIMSPPGQGKTTILRDLARRMSEESKKNILICDERGEIGRIGVGETCDVISFADKKTAFEVGIRTMRPDIMITDELTADDYQAIQRAKESGVMVIASAHYYQNEKPPFFGLFDWYVLLDSIKIGEIKEIYDRNYKKVCLT